MKYTRREILKAGASGLLLATTGMPLQASEPSLEELAQEWGMPLSRVQEIARECRQPVEETLRGSGVVYVTKYRGRDLDWRNSTDLRIIQANRQREVYQEHLPPSERKPVLEFFYQNNNNLNWNDGAGKHLASVFCAVSNGLKGTVVTLGFKISEKEISQEAGNAFRRNFGLKYTPTISIYETTSTGTLKKHHMSFEPGFRGMKHWKNWHDGILNYLHDKIIN